MVVWVFSGGGVSEMRALIPFLSSNLSECFFERKTSLLKEMRARNDFQKVRTHRVCS
jgi:hypothetical protein